MVAHLLLVNLVVGVVFKLWLLETILVVDGNIGDPVVFVLILFNRVLVVQKVRMSLDDGASVWNDQTAAEAVQFGGVEVWIPFKTGSEVVFKATP